MEWWVQVILAVTGYLLGMAFAGSFLGRKWMGTVDVALHRVFRRRVTTGKYLYWKFFCNIENPPRPKNLERPEKLSDRVLARLLAACS